MYSSVVCALLFVLSVPAYAGVSGAQIGTVVNASSVSHVQYNKGMISVHFQRVPLRLALQQISAATGLIFHVDKEVRGTVSFKTKSMLLDRAMYRMFRQYNNAFVFDDVNGVPGLREVNLFRQGAAGLVVAAQSDTIKAGVLDIRSTSAATQQALSMHAGRQAVNTVTTGNARRVVTVNPLSSAGPAQMMQAIRQTERSIVMIHRKMNGEVRAIKSQQVKLREKLARPGLQGKKDLIKRMGLLNVQVARAKQNNVSMLINEQKSLQELTTMQKSYVNPAQQKHIILARQNRQMSISKAKLQQQRDLARMIHKP